MRIPRINFTTEQEQFLIDNNYQRTAQQVADLYNENFDNKITSNDVICFRKRKKLKCGVNCTFKKGNIPHNKGKVWDDYMPKDSQENSKKTQFQKGSKPHNWLPVGSEWVSEKGYTYIKIAEPNDWQLKHRYIYEKNFGKIPNDSSVVFLDQDKTNFSLDNLQLVKTKDKLIAKNKGLLTSDKETTRTGLKVAELINKTYEIKGGK